MSQLSSDGISIKISGNYSYFDLFYQMPISWSDPSPPIMTQLSSGILKFKMHPGWAIVSLQPAGSLGMLKLSIHPGYFSPLSLSRSIGEKSSLRFKLVGEWFSLSSSMSMLWMLEGDTWISCGSWPNVYIFSENKGVEAWWFCVFFCATLPPALKQFSGRNPTGWELSCL